MTLLLVVLASAEPTSRGASSFFLPEGAPYAQAPTPEALLTFRRGPHPVCTAKKPVPALADACAIHRHLTSEALPSKRLRATARRVLESLDPPKQALLSARLQLVRALRTQPCLQQQGVALFAAQESQLILTRQRETLQSYTSALRSMNRSDAVEVLPELITLVRTPYERLASTLPEQIAADYSGRINLLPRGLVSSLRVLARSVGYHLSDRATRPITVEAIRPEPSKRATLWLEGEELLTRAAGSIESIRLSGTEALEALKERMVGQHPEAVHAAPLAGLLGFKQLRPQLLFLSQLDVPELRRAGMIGRLALADPADHDELTKWLIKSPPDVDATVAKALRRFSDLASQRIRRVLPSQWPLPILRALVDQSDRFDQRPWYTALLEHKDTQIKVLAYAAMRKTKPEDWLTARLARFDACSAKHLRLLMPEPQRPQAKTRRAPAKAGSKTDTAAAEAAPLPEAEEIDDSAGSVVIPEGD